MNKNLFKTQKQAPVADTRNAAGGRAYTMSPKHTLSQITATNCFNGTYYVDAETNLQLAKDAAQALANDPLFLAKAAVYGRQKAYMKDMPAFLVAMLAKVCRDLPNEDPNKNLFRKVFPKVIDNGKMLRNFIQIARSGQLGKVFNVGSGSIRHAIRDWFTSKSPWAIFKASIGNDPSMRDILRMARPKPENEEKAALYAYLKGGAFDKEDGMFRVFKRKGQSKETYLAHEHSYDSLPDIVKQYESYKTNKEGLPPDVDFRLLDSLGLDKEGWKQIARNAGWMMTRMNLNTFQRHDVFEDKELVKIIAERLRNREEIKKARAFPYQLMMAYTMTSGVPFEIQEALQDAMEIAIDNVPVINGKIAVCVDVSGSMGSPVTGTRPGVSSKVRCVDCAALFASAIFRKNPTALILPFDTNVYQLRLNPRDSVATNATTLAKFGGGGTNCSLALHALNQKREKLDAVVFISDYESWVDSGCGYSTGLFGARYNSVVQSTGMLQEWTTFKQHNKDAVLVCIDLTPRNNSQVKERPGILQVGGFGDSVFNVVSDFIESGTNGSDYWVDLIEKTEI